MLLTILTRATSDDVDELMVIDAESFEPPWRRERFLQGLVMPQSPLAVIKNGEDKIYGFLSTQCRNKYVGIERLVIAPEFRRKGVATNVLTALILALKANDPPAKGTAHRTHLRTVVRADDTVSLRMFQKSGFVALCVYPRYYSNPNGTQEDAVMLRYCANPAGNVVGFTSKHDQTNRISNLYK